LDIISNGVNAGDQPFPEFFLDDSFNDVSEFGVVEGAGFIPRDSDNDGRADFRDPDSDNDSLFDVVEGFGFLFDSDGNGELDDFNDADVNLPI